MLKIRAILFIFYWVKRILLLFLMTMMVSFGIFFLVNSIRSSANLPDLPYKPDELLVKLKEDRHLYRIRFSENISPEEMIKEYQESSYVEYVQPNFIYQAASLKPNDPEYLKQWYLPKIKAPEAWPDTVGSPQVTIAILDTGVDIDHPDLKDNIWQNTKEVKGDGLDNDGNGYVDDIYGWDFVANEADPNPKYKLGFTTEAITHGTVVAGVAAARGNNNLGVAGLSWQSKIMPLRVLDSQGEGNSATVVEAVNYAVAQGVNIVNLSFVGTGFDQALEKSIQEAFDSGLIIVAAAGNDRLLSIDEGGNLNFFGRYPVCYQGQAGENVILGVAATDQLDAKTLFSNYGASCVDLVAPGEGIFSTQVFEPAQKGLRGYYSGGWSGTSLSSPMVAGLAALVKAVNPDLSAAQIVELIINNTDDISEMNPIYELDLGSGRINVQKTIEAALLTVKLEVQEENKEEVSKESKETTINNLVFNLITGAGPGGGPHLRIFGPNGRLLGSFFAYDEAFRGGISVASGDLDQDGLSEIITGALRGAGPEVRVFDAHGQLKSRFFAYDEAFRGGVNVASGDLDGDGRAEIITGAGPGGGPHLRIFGPNGRLLGSFFAYDEAFRGGISVALGDLDQDGLSEIITGALRGAGPEVRVFDAHGQLKSRFFAYDEAFRGGVNVASGAGGS